MVEYAPEVIQEFAERLYSQARWLAARWTGVGALIGWVSGYAASKSGVGNWAYLLMPLVALVAYRIGEGRGFRLRLEAQRALVQVKIEENTRPARA